MRHLLRFSPSKLRLISFHQGGSLYGAEGELLDDGIAEGKMLVEGVVEGDKDGVGHSTFMQDQVPLVAGTPSQKHSCFGYGPTSGHS